MLCGLAHIGGRPVALVANQPKVIAGSIDAAAADKAAHFINVADAFHVPLLFLADNPGMLPRQPLRAGRRTAGGARMFGADTGDDAEDPHHVAQGVRLRIDGHVDGRFRQSGRDVRIPGATLGAMEAGAAGRE